MDPDRAYERAGLLKAFAHPTRLRILGELSKGTRCVTDMEDILPVTQVNISQHLTVLRNAKLVDFAQDGGDPVLLPEPAETGGRRSGASRGGTPRHPEDQGADRPRKGQGREGEGGGPW